MPGVIGKNHISQVLQAFADHKEEKLGNDGLLERLSNFVAIWDEFSERWQLEETTITEFFELDPVLAKKYGLYLEEFDDSIELMHEILELTEDLEDGTTDLGALEKKVEQFTRKVCTASAGVFAELDTETSSSSRP